MHQPWEEIILTNLVRSITSRPLSKSSKSEGEVGGGSGTPAVAMLWHRKNNIAVMMRGAGGWLGNCASCTKGEWCTSLCVDGHRCRLAVSCLPCCLLIDEEGYRHGWCASSVWFFPENEGRKMIFKSQKPLALLALCQTFKKIWQPLIFRIMYWFFVG